MSSDIEALRAAREWAAEHVHPQPDDRMLRAYGQALVPAFLLPLLDLTADELRALVLAASQQAEDMTYDDGHGGEYTTADPVLLSALDKLTTTKEAPDA